MIKDNRLRQKIITGALLALFLGIALYFRIAFPYHLVFGSEQVKFTGNDAWYHIRIIDNLVHNFPHLNSFDPYMLFPGGGSTSSHFPFFDYLLAGIIWLIGLGSPTEHTVNVVAAYFPAILGALTVIPVYFIGKSLFNRWAGIVSAGLIAILPGEFLHRSTLGFTDHHVAEAFFTTTAMLFLILAIKNSKREQLTLAHFRHPNKTSITRPMIYSLLAGVFLGIYLISWMGALLFVFILTIYFLIQFTIDHLRQKPVDYLCLVGVITLSTALVISAPINRDKLFLASLAIALIVPIALTTVSRLMSHRKLRPFYYPLALSGAGLAALGVLYAIDSALFKSMVDSLAIFSWDIHTANSEMYPLLFPGGKFSFTLTWETFTTSSFLSLVALGLLVYVLVKKRGEADKTLLIVWTLVILAATLAQFRYTYYLAVNVALLTGYLSWQILRSVGLQGRAPESATKLPLPKRKKVKAKPKKFRLSDVRIPARWVYVTLTAIVLFFLVFFPNIGKARAKASQVPAGAPSDAWCEVLSWLRSEENTPEPFGNPDFYYERYATLFEYPETAYGVTAWWDYGYWIVRIAHRIPSDNPGSGATLGRSEVAQLFVAQDEASASTLMDDLRSEYLIIDYQNASGFFYAEVARSGGRVVKSSITGYPYPVDFFDEFYDPNAKELIVMYFPEYYRSLCVRLYNFGGKAVTPETCTVISWQLRKTDQNTFVKYITDRQEFPTYEEASAYIAENTPKQTSEDHYQIVSPNPFGSPITLDKLEHFGPAYDSESSVTTMTSPVPAVRVFEYEK
ncbi:MAG: oligosaccharyl transferase, archaeosortase A system-associated [Chloroflexi bacterium]|nr:oligosaccharyl transferase, archaeosortase A system-associated [Chloroflexota bacterium]